MTLLRSALRFVSLLALPLLIGAYPQCGGPNSTYIFGQPDPQTCSAPIDPYLKKIPPSQEFCLFFVPNLAGRWYQQFSSNRTQVARDFQQGQACIVADYTTVTNNCTNCGYRYNFTVVHTALNSNGSIVTYRGSGTDQAVINFPAKLTTLYPNFPTLFPLLTYNYGALHGSVRTQYVIRRDPNNKWILLSDFGCQTLFLLTRTPTMTTAIRQTVMAAINSTYFGWDAVIPTYQGSNCWYSK